MNHLEKTYWEMEKECIIFGNNNIAILEKYNPVKREFDLLVANEKEITKNVKTQNESDTEGLVAQKKQDLELLTKDFYRVCCGLSHKAKITNDLILLNSVDFSESKLLSGDEKEILTRLQSLLEIFRKKTEELADYSITPEFIDELESRLNKFNELPESISIQNSNRKNATHIIKDLIVESRAILDRLDNALEAIITDEKFLNAWFDVRKIKGRRRIKENGNEEVQVEENKTEE